MAKNGAVIPRGFAGLAELATDVSDLMSTTNSHSSVKKVSPKHSPQSSNPSHSLTRSTEVEKKSSKAKGNEGTIWLFLIAGIIITVSIIIANNGKQNIQLQKKSRLKTETQMPVTSPVEVKPRGTQSPRIDLRLAINTGKLAIDSLEQEIRQIDSSLKSYETELDIYKDLGRIDDYNILVERHNALLEKRKASFVNYARLIDEVNEKVRRYNAGER